MEKKKLNKNIFIIVVCWLVYTCSYIGKLGYNANILLFESEFGITHAQSGAVGTAFFFAYGVGQVINGIFCKKYNITLMVFFALIISAVCNLLLTIIGDFSFFKFVWLINGAALSCLWSLLIRFLSEKLDDAYVSKAIVAMGTTVAVGTFAVYGLSALFVKLSAFKTIFYVAAVLMPVIGSLWLVLNAWLKKENPPENISEISASEEKTAQPVGNKPAGNNPGGYKYNKEFILSLCVLAFFAIITNLVKDGITVWVPNMLKELYVMPDYLSILLTLALPLVSVFGTAVAVFSNKYIKNFINLCGVYFIVTVAVLAVIILFGNTSAVIMIIALSVISLLMAGTNNIITSIAPLSYKQTANAGMLAGVLNGSCYIGSTLSSYCLGMIADKSGWNGVFYILLAAAALCCVISVICLFVQKSKNTK